MFGLRARLVRRPSGNHTGNSGKSSWWSRKRAATIALTALASFSLPAAPANAAPSDFLYVANHDDNNVSVIDTSTDTVVGTPITVGAGPIAIAMLPNGTKAYVSNELSNNVSVIDTADRTVTATIGVGVHPRGIAVTPDGTKAYVADNGSNEVSVIDTATDTVSGTISVAGGPLAVAISPDGDTAYVVDVGANNVSVINTATDTVSTTISVGNTPSDVVFTPNGAKAYVTNFGAGTVSVIDTATNTVTGSPITVGTSPNGLDILPNGSKVYVANAASNSVSVINTSTDTVSTTITTNIGANPQDTVATENGQKVYVPNHDDNNVSVIDTATDTASPTQVSVGTGPGGAAASPSQGDTVVTFQVSPTDGLTITVPDTATLSTVTPGGTATGQLGNVTVNDQRSLADATWNSTASLSQDFTTSGGSPISGGAVTYTPGAPVAQTNGPFTAGTPGTLAGARTAYSKTSGSGDNSVTWNPTLDVAVPAAAVAGIYTGTITHSVA